MPFSDSAVFQIISGGWHQGGGGERPLGALFAKAFRQSAIVDSVLQPEPAGGGLEMRHDARVGGLFAGAIGGVWRDWGNDPRPGVVLELHSQYGEVVGRPW